MAGAAELDIRQRPLARTVYALAARRFSGRLRAGEGRAVALEWDRGRIVAADSSFPADSLARVAVAAKLITPDQAKTALERASSGAALESALAEAAALDDRGRQALARRGLVQRAARLFAIEEGRLLVEEASPAASGRDTYSLDPRWLIARGVLAHYAEPRLVRELRPIRDRRVALAADAAPNLEAFQLPASDAPLLEALRQGPRALEAVIRAANLERRRALALIYVLLATDCLDVEAATTPEPPPAAKAPKPRAPAPKASAPKPAARPSRDIESLIATIQERLDAGADAFALLGVSRGAPDGEVRKAYFELAKKLHPDRLQAVGLGGRTDAQRVFAEINRAFGILGDSRKRADYERDLERGGGDDRAVAERTARIVAAEEHARRGEAALRQSQFEAAARELEKAVELNPDEGEHHALAAWAAWSTARDKSKVLEGVLARFARAAELAPKSAATHYYRGQVAKQSGDTETADACFRKVLELRPDHREAALELKLLERRRTARSTGGSLLKKLKRS